MVQIHVGSRELARRAQNCAPDPVNLLLTADEMAELRAKELIELEQAQESPYWWESQLGDRRPVRKSRRPRGAG